jgi:quercetin dioxygenase-like cupin family protein
MASRKRHGKEVMAMREERRAENGVTYVALGQGKSVWIGDRELVTFKETGEDTDGLFAVVEVVGLPGSGPPPHIHHRVDEVYCLLEGELEVLDGGRTFTAEAGSLFRIPKGTLHAWKNGTNETARTLLFICPAGFEGFFEEAGVPATDLSSPPPPPTQKDLQRMLELGRKYDTEYPSPPGG